MHPPGAGTVLVRYGEVGIKSDQLRTRMEKQLQANSRAILDDRDLPGSVEQAYTRLYVHTTPARIDEVTDAVTDAFGVVSASPALRVDPTMAAICDALADAARDQYDGQTFAVRAQRAGPQSAHPFSSPELEREGGSVVHTAAQEEGYEPTVDLDDPEMTFSVECRQDDAYVFLERRDGPGGLPVGTQKPLVALVSGGIDSPVAAWLTMKRGAPVIPLYVDLGEYGGVDHRMRAIDTVERLRRFAPNVDCRLRVAPGGEGIEQIAGVTEMYRMLVARRFMFRIAAAVAEDVGAVGVVTGESIGQKSSQTTANLRVTSAAIDLPIHRPLLSMDKPEITERAKKIGSYDDSTIDAGCQQLAPEAPATQPPLERIGAAEPDDLARLAAEAAAAITVADGDPSA
ncbi:tRNA sulfurtransferase [Halobacteriaceae archaeon SHR40]|uniref:tRNA sulfurtransferase n=1 Tax=Halovenus amylolytica TaxID=2500550 RepID=UPI000FE40419